MKQIANYTRPAFLGDHPPVLARMILSGGESGAVFKSGSVLGRNPAGDVEIWTGASADVAGILASDVEIAANESTIADVYIHASVVANELVFAESVEDTEKIKALAALSAKGIYSEITWALADSKTGESTEQTGSDTE